MGHTKDKCWKKNVKGPSTFANFLEVLVNEEKAMLVELNILCGVKHNVFVVSRCPRGGYLYMHQNLEEG